MPVSSCIPNSEVGAAEDWNGRLLGAESATGCPCDSALRFFPALPYWHVATLAYTLSPRRGVYTGVELYVKVFFAGAYTCPELPTCSHIEEYSFESYTASYQGPRYIPQCRGLGSSGIVPWAVQLDAR